MLPSASTMLTESSITMTPPDPPIEPIMREGVEIHRDVLEAPVVLDHLGPDLALALEALAELEDLGGGAAGDDRLELAARAAARRRPRSGAGPA